MAFRAKTAVGLIALAAPALRAQEFTMRHDHVRKSGAGILRFTSAGLGWTEEVKHSEHSRSWRWAQIQRLELSPVRVRVLTYDDVGWQLGRDREYQFEGLPKGAAAQLYPLLAGILDQRFAAQVADPVPAPLWETPAKLLLGRRGSNGTLKAAADRMVFDGGETGESRTWRIRDIQQVASSGPFDLTLTTLQGENRLQLKQPLPEDRFNALWQTVEEARGLRIYNSQQKGPSHD
jgi:hypothetical protein